MLAQLDQLVRLARKVPLGQQVLQDQLAQLVRLVHKEVSVESHLTTRLIQIRTKLTRVQESSSLTMPT
jgi:hypothetical protein